MNIRQRFISLLLRQKSKQECHQVLSKWSTYYSGLSEGNKKSFIVRTLLFLRTTYFKSKDGFEVTLEMKLVICSAFVQITFGLRRDALDLFNTVFITPSSYAYKGRDEFYDGDVNPFTKRVNLSWPAVEKGFIITDDGLNIAIHEFGHCLIIENSKRSYLQRTFNERDLNKWKAMAIKKIPLVREGNYKIFREYGGSNLMELFSITLETFFEKPHEFFSYSPTFYRLTSKVLQQDPRNTKNPKKYKN